MKLQSCTFALLFFACLMIACTGNKRVKTIKQVHYDYNDSIRQAQDLKYLEYDSVVFSDGSYATYRLQYAPQNSLYEFFDKKGRIIATIAQASECYPQVIVYKYDDNNRLTHFLSFWNHFEKNYLDWYGASDTINYETFRNKIDSVDFNAPDTARYDYTSIEYYNTGIAIRTRHINTGEIIEAPERYMLDVSVDQCPPFWASDLDGGRYVYKVCIKPQDTNAKNYTLFRYANFKPALEENYENGVRIRAVVYPHQSYSDRHKWIKTLTSQNGNNIYTSHIENSQDTLKTVWRNHYLRHMQKVSMYGTVLEQDTYIYALPSSQVKVIHEKIDFASMKLKKVSESLTTISQIGMEDDEMKLLKNCVDWENVYSTNDIY